MTVILSFFTCSDEASPHTLQMRRLPSTPATLLSFSLSSLTPARPDSVFSALQQQGRFATIVGI